VLSTSEYLIIWTKLKDIQMDLFYLSIILLLLSWRVISHMASRKLSKMKTWCYLF